MKRIVLVTGGFDPLHSGHIEYFKAAKQLGDILVVGVNSNEWLIRKKGAFFMPILERTAIVKNIVGVDFVIAFDDHDNTANHAITMVKQSYPHDQIVFANGGDRTVDNIPEMIDDNKDVEFLFGVGGSDKKNSSSWILDEWKAPKTERPWGFYRVLYQTQRTKVKELTVNPGCSLSMQRHSQRNEFWHVVEGSGYVNTVQSGTSRKITLNPHNNISIAIGTWHQLYNNGTNNLKIIEIQYGFRCDEDDISRDFNTTV